MFEKTKINEKEAGMAHLKKILNKGKAMKRLIFQFVFCLKYEVGI